MTALSISEILKTPAFQYATVIAGQKGLNKKVDWAHILEMVDCSDYVNGHELILTTGLGWEKEEDINTFVQNLIEKNVTAMCLQLGKKFNRYRTVADIPDKVIEEANRFNFPLIVFPEEHDCRYIDLIKNIHSMIINRNYKIFVDQEEFLNRFYLMLINNHDIDDILYFIHKNLGIGVVYKQSNGSIRVIPKVSMSEKANLENLLQQDFPVETISVDCNCLQLAIKKISACGQELGILALFGKNRQLTDFDYLVLNKCTHALAQEYIGALYLKEKKNLSQERWIRKWLTGKLNNNDIENKIKIEEPSITPQGCLACLAEFSSNYEEKESVKKTFVQIAGIARTILEKKGFYLFPYKQNNTTIFLLINTQGPHTWKRRLEEALKETGNLALNGHFNNQYRKIYFYVGKLVKNLASINESLESAKKAFYIKSMIPEKNIVFFENLFVYRLILMLENRSELKNFVHDYLKPIMDNNNKPDPALLKTMIALRDNHYNKKETAKTLYIARQSLYQRINKLEELLGQDFISSAEKRISLEVALYGLEFLNAKNSSVKNVKNNPNEIGS